MTKANLMRWLIARNKERDCIRRMFFGDKQVDEWEKQIREHFAGDKADLIVEDDIVVVVEE